MVLVILDPKAQSITAPSPWLCEVLVDEEGEPIHPVVCGNGAGFAVHHERRYYYICDSCLKKHRVRFPE